MAEGRSNSFTKGQEVILSVTPIITGCVSFTASATILVMILRSPKKFGNPFRRIFFAMCLYDMLQSLGNILSTFPAPAHIATDVWGAIGNQATCVSQGVLLQVRFFISSHVSKGTLIIVWMMMMAQ